MAIRLQSPTALVVAPPLAPALRRRLFLTFAPKRVLGAVAAQSARGLDALLPGMERTVRRPIAKPFDAKSIIEE